jgi:hypothetical protein
MEEITIIDIFNINVIKTIPDNSQISKDKSKITNTLIPNDNSDFKSKIDILYNILYN